MSLTTQKYLINQCTLNAVIQLTDYYKKLGYRINQIRKEKGLTQEQLAYKSDVERAKISRIENGNEDFYFKTLLKIAEALEVKPCDLLDF